MAIIMVALAVFFDIVVKFGHGELVMHPYLALSVCFSQLQLSAFIFN